MYVSVFYKRFNLGHTKIIAIMSQPYRASIQLLKINVYIYKCTGIGSVLTKFRSRILYWGGKMVSENLYFTRDGYC